MKKLICVLASVMFIFNGGVHLAEASSRGGKAQLQGETTTSSQTKSKKTSYRQGSKKPQTTKQKQHQKKENKEKRAANQAKRDFKKK